jgi:hypothetical protein
VKAGGRDPAVYHAGMSPEPAPARIVTALIVAAATFALVACQPPPDPIVVQRHRVTINNPTDEPWHDVVVNVNGYYQVQTRELGPKGRLDAPVDRMQNAYGRFFDPKRERVREVKLTATTEGGGRIEHTWRDEGGLVR